MPALDVISLEVEGYAHTTTPNTVAGTSSNLTSGTEYLIIAAGNQANNGGGGTVHDMTFLVGSTVLGRAAGDRGAFTPSASLATSGNGGYMQIALAATYTPGSAEAMSLEAWAGAGSGTAYCRGYAIDLSDIPGPGSGDSQARWHEETAQNDTIVDTPTSGFEVVGTALTFTAPRAGEYLIIASVELVDDGTAAATDEFDVRLVLDSTTLDGTPIQQDTTSRTAAVMGCLWMRVETLTAASHTIEIELNGTSSNGNVGARRVNIHAIEVAAFEAGDVQEDTDAFETVTGTTSQDTGHSLTIGDGSSDYLLFCQWQKQASFWAEAYFVVGATEEPTNGFGVGADDFGTGASNDQPMEMGLYITSAPAASTALGTRINKVGGGGSNEHGTSTNRASIGGSMYLIAIRLASAIRTVMASPLPAPTMSASGTVGSSGPSATMDASLPVPTANIDAGAATVSSLAVDLPAPTAALAGSVGAAIGSALATDLPVPTADIEASQGAVATVSSDLPVPDAALAATAAHPAALAADLPTPEMAAASTAATAAGMAADLPAPDMAASAVRGQEAALAATLPAPEMTAASNVALPPSASLDVDLPVPEMAGVAQRPASTVLAGDLPVPEMATAATRATSAALAADLPTVLADFNTETAPVGLLSSILPVPEMSAVGDAPPDPDGGSGGSGEVVWTPEVWTPEIVEPEVWTPAPWGSVLGGDILAALSDGFEGATLDPSWTIEDDNGALEGASGIVSGEYNLRLSAGGAAGSWWFDDRSGVLIYREIVGPFMCRVRVRVRNDADTALPPTGSFGKYMGIAAHDPDRSALNYVHIVAGSDAAASVEWKTTDAEPGGSTNTTAWDPSTVPPNTTVEVDLQLVRRASNQQLFDMYYRDATGGHALADDDPPFTLLQTIDRTDNTSPGRAAFGAGADLAVPLPARLRVGMVGYSVAAADDVQGFFDGIIFSRDHSSIT